MRDVPSRALPDIFSRKLAKGFWINFDAIYLSVGAELWDFTRRRFEARINLSPSRSHGLAMDYKFTSDGRGIYFRLTDAELDAARRLSHDVGASLKEFISTLQVIVPTKSANWQRVSR
jgi:hypothetical protein